MQTDREILRLVAKAAGITVMAWNDGFEPYSSGLGFTLESDAIWNPLTDDGDAMRLAVMLGISVIPYPIYDQPKHSVLAEVKQRLVDTRVTPEKQLPLNAARNEHIELYGDNPYAATRRAIVRAAAAIGKESK